MEELIGQITARTGASNSQATQVVQITIDFIKDRLPAEDAAQVERAVSVAQAAGGQRPSAGRY